MCFKIQLVIIRPFGRRDKEFVSGEKEFANIVLFLMMIEY